MKSFLAACAMCGLLAGASAFAADTAPAPVKDAPPADAAAAPAEAPAAPEIDPAPFKTVKEKASYSIGMMIATQLKSQQIEIDADTLAQGMKDTLSGGKTLITEQQAGETMMGLEKKMMAEQAAKVKAEGEKNQKDGEAFLAQNATKEGVKTLPDGLQYTVIKEGDGPMPGQGDKVMVNYTGTLVDGTEFDSSAKAGQPVSLTINNVIKGMSEALKMMKVGSKWHLVIPSNLAYGERGAGQVIGPNAVIVFDIELVSIERATAVPGAPVAPTAPAAPAN